MVEEKRGAINERVRRERQAAQLRANLKRRKEKVRGDDAVAEPPAAAAGQTGPPRRDEQD